MPHLHQLGEHVHPSSLRSDDPNINGAGRKGLEDVESEDGVDRREETSGGISEV